MAHSTPQEAIINGIIAALSANGLFDVTKINSWRKPYKKPKTRMNAGS